VGRAAVSAPPVGQAFVDDEGVYWRVANVITGKNLDGFFLVRLEHGHGLECKDGSLVLAPMEYEALLRSRGLKALAPDVLDAVPLHGDSTSPPAASSTITLGGPHAS
jgi:hypothetical protein